MGLLPGLGWADINPASTSLTNGCYPTISLNEQTLPGNGLVSAFDYQSALADTGLAQTLAQQRKALAEFDTGTLEAREESVAFWINAYNFSCSNRFLLSGRMANWFHPSGIMAAE